MRLPPLAGLDRSDDGSLDLRQWWVTGRFRSEKLEAVYAVHNFAVWRPRMRIIGSICIAVEVYSVVDGIFCQCGTRFGTYTGAYLVYACTLPSAVLLVFTSVVLSPRFSNVMAPKFIVIFCSTCILLAVGYTLPLAAFLNANPLTGNATFAFSMRESCCADREAASDLCRAKTDELTGDAAFTTSTIAILTAVFSTIATSVGVGVGGYILFSSLVLGLVAWYQLMRFEHEFGILPAAIPQTAVLLVQAHTMHTLQLHPGHASH